MRHLTKKIEPYHNILSCDNLFQSHGEDPTKSEWKKNLSCFQQFMAWEQQGN